jgi:predicted nucleic acid-binding protein
LFVIEGLFANLEILPWGSEEAAIYAKAKATLETQGIGFSLMDFLIGVHAAATGAVLVSSDTVFSRMSRTTKPLRVWKSPGRMLTGEAAG